MVRNDPLPTKSANKFAPLKFLAQTASLCGVDQAFDRTRSRRPASGTSQVACKDCILAPAKVFMQGPCLLGLLLLTGICRLILACLGAVHRHPKARTWYQETALCVGTPLWDLKECPIILHLLSSRFQMESQRF